MTFFDEHEKKTFEAEWLGTSDKEIFFDKGKLIGLYLAWRFIQDGGGSFRTLVYDYMNLPYVDVQTTGHGLDFCNWVFDGTRGAPAEAGHDQSAVPVTVPVGKE